MQTKPAINYIFVKDKKHLKKLITKEMENHGLCCDLNHLDVSGIQDMSSLFSESHFNGDISRWDGSSVKNMDWIFEESFFNGGVSKWRVSNVLSRRWMFCDSEFKGDLRPWCLTKKELVSAFETSLPAYLLHRTAIEEREQLIARYSPPQKKTSRVL
jgi:hypothetical protein